MGLAVCLTTGCTASQLTERDVGPARVTDSVGAPIGPASEPWVSVTVVDGRLMLRVTSVRTCAVTRTEVRERERIEETRVGAAPSVVSALLLAAGFYLYMETDSPARDSMSTGSVLVGSAAVIYGVPALMSGTRVTRLEPRTRTLPAQLVPCASQPLANALVELVDEVGVAEATTDAEGRARLRTPFGAMQIFVDGEPARIVQGAP